MTAIKINLKKALRLRKEVEAALKQVEADMKFTLTFDVFASGSVEKILTDENDRIKQAYLDYSLLSNFLRNLRVKISRENNGDVEVALAQIAHFDRLITMIRKFAAVTPKVDIEAIQRDRDVSMARLTNTSTGSDYYSRLEDKKMSVNFLFEHNRNEILSGLPFCIAQKEAAEDLRNRKNLESNIEIADADVTLLRKYNIIVG